jgi:hypothetical protein
MKNDHFARNQVVGACKASLHWCRLTLLTECRLRYMGEMDATFGGRLRAPGLIGCMAAFLCACAMGVSVDDDLDAVDSAANVGRGLDAGSSEEAGEEPEPEPELDSGMISWLDASSSGSSEAGSRDAASSAAQDASRPDAAGDASADAARDSGGGTTGGGTTGGGTTGGGTTGGGTTGGGTPGGGTADAGGGTKDAGTPDAGGGTIGGGNMCKASECKNECGVASGPIRCCQRDGTCGCSWFSLAYCD